MFLYYLITTLHVLVCIILILVVLLQSGKGADLAGAFGGGGTQTAFGSRGPASFLSKMTTVAAIIFMLTSISLSTITRKVENKSILDTSPGKTTPAAKTPTLPPVPTPTKEQINKQLEEAQKKQQQKPSGTPAEQNAQPTQKPEPAKGTPPK